MAKPFTPRQGQYLAFIHKYIQRNGCSPAELDISRHFGVSAPSAHQMVVTLENLGLIERTPGVPRSIRLLIAERELPDSEYGARNTEHIPTFEASYPAIAFFVKNIGRVTIGKQWDTSSPAAAISETEVVWEAGGRYDNLDKLLQDMNAGIENWCALNE